MNNISISVVLPAFNEEDNIQRTVDSVLEYIEERKFQEYEIIVVNDGSADRTPEIVEAMASRNGRVKLVNHERNLGYGAALRSGFYNASLNYIFLMDSDGQFDIQNLEKLLPFLGDYDLVIGYRKKRADSPVRSLNTWLYHLFIFFLFSLRTKDMDCAFKIFSKRVLETISPLKSQGALISAEFLVKAKREGFSIKEIPVGHYPRRFGKQTGANLRVILRMFKECWRLRGEMR